MQDEQWRCGGGNADTVSKQWLLSSTHQSASRSGHSYLLWMWQSLCAQALCFMNCCNGLLVCMFLAKIRWLMSLYLRQIDVSVFVGPCPVLCCFAVLICGETQIWLGDLRVACGCGFVFCFFVGVRLNDLRIFTDRTCPCTLLLFTAYAIVRTEPSATSAIPEEKKNRKASHWSHNAVWNRKNMEPRQGYTLKQLWEDCGTAIGRKTSPYYDTKDNDTRRAVEAIANLPAATAPESPLLWALGTPAQRDVPPQNATLTQRAMEEWERTLCENKAVAIFEQMQEGRPALIQKDGGEMLIAMVLDRPLSEAQALVEDPAAFFHKKRPRCFSQSGIIRFSDKCSKQLKVKAYPSTEGGTSSTDTPNRSTASRQVQFQ